MQKTPATCAPLTKHLFIWHAAVENAPAQDGHDQDGPKALRRRQVGHSKEIPDTGDVRESFCAVLT
jgi:hypothetical protein